MDESGNGYIKWGNPDSGRKNTACSLSYADSSFNSYICVYNYKYEEVYRSLKLYRREDRKSVLRRRVKKIQHLKAERGLQEEERRRKGIRKRVGTQQQQNKFAVSQWNSDFVCQLKNKWKEKKW